MDWLQSSAQLSLSDRCLRAAPAGATRICFVPTRAFVVGILVTLVVLRSSADEVDLRVRRGDSVLLESSRSGFGPLGSFETRLTLRKSALNRCLPEDDEGERKQDSLTFQQVSVQFGDASAIGVDHVRFLRRDNHDATWLLHPRDLLTLLEFCLIQPKDRRTVPSISTPVIIAHRGASGYLPEHTPEATAMAHALGADFIEQDVVLSRDLVPVVLHDIHLETVTNVAEVFPNRHRQDGRWYAFDFDLQELKALVVSERKQSDSGQPVFPKRFPVGQGNFHIATLAEMVELIQGLNASTGRTVGIYPELKEPAWHRDQGADLTQIVLRVLDRYGYREFQHPVFIQCFEADELKRIRGALKCELKLVQLIASDDQWTEAGLRDIATYADAVGPSLDRVFERSTGDQSTGDQSTGDGPSVSPCIRAAHQLGLVVHPYTIRQDELPEFAHSMRGLLDMIQRADIDGYFTDFPDAR